MSAPTRQATPQAAPKPKQPPHAFTLRIMLRHTDFFGNRHRVREYDCAVDKYDRHRSPHGEVRAYTRGGQFSVVAPTYQLARRALRNAIRATLRSTGEIGR